MIEFLFSQPKRNELSAFYIEVFPVKQNGFRELSLISNRDVPGWGIGTLELVSRIRRCHFPTISNVREGAPGFSRTAMLVFATAFSGKPRFSEVSPLSPHTRLPS